mmetsp:Transcript_19548/g.52702  ORF Transcript_19548/g.52702 Transcript_19548/m.52702 type:complete len:263 (+) Transcript_19548:123-911(+)
MQTLRGHVLQPRAPLQRLLLCHVPRDLHPRHCDPGHRGRVLGRPLGRVPEQQPARLRHRARAHLHRPLPLRVVPQLAVCGGAARQGRGEQVLEHVPLRPCGARVHPLSRLQYRLARLHGLGPRDRRARGLLRLQPLALRRHTRVLCHRDLLPCVRTHDPRCLANERVLRGGPAAHGGGARAPARDPRSPWRSQPGQASAQLPANHWLLLQGSPTSQILGAAARARNSRARPATGIHEPRAACVRARAPVAVTARCVRVPCGR